MLITLYKLMQEPPGFCSSLVLPHPHHPYIMKYACSKAAWVPVTFKVEKSVCIFKVFHKLTLTYLLTISPTVSLQRLLFPTLLLDTVSPEHVSPTLKSHFLGSLTEVCTKQANGWEVSIYSTSKNQHIFMMKRPLAIGWFKSLKL